MIGARLIDNHLILTPANALFEREVPEHIALRAALRAVLYQAAEALPPDVPLILTDALAQSDAGSDLIEPSLALAHKRGARFVPVLLTISEDENLRRVADPSRTGIGKLTDRAILQDLRLRHELLRLPGVRELDVTDLSAAQAATRIAEMI